MINNKLYPLFTSQDEPETPEDTEGAETEEETEEETEKETPETGEEIQ